MQSGHQCGKKINKQNGEVSAYSTGERTENCKGEDTTKFLKYSQPPLLYTGTSLGVSTHAQKVGTGRVQGWKKRRGERGKAP